MIWLASFSVQLRKSCRRSAGATSVAPGPPLQSRASLFFPAIRTRIPWQHSKKALMIERA